MRHPLLSLLVLLLLVQLLWVDVLLPHKPPGDSVPPFCPELAAPSLPAVSPSTPPITSHTRFPRTASGLEGGRLTVGGVGLEDSREAVVARLGEAVTDEYGTLCYERRGLSVSLDRSDRVEKILGETVERDGRPWLRSGMRMRDVEQLLGPPTDACAQSETFRAGSLELSVERDQRDLPDDLRDFHSHQGLRFELSTLLPEPPRVQVASLTPPLPGRPRAETVGCTFEPGRSKHPIPLAWTAHLTQVESPSLGAQDDRRLAICDARHILALDLQAPALSWQRKLAGLGSLPEGAGHAWSSQEATEGERLFFLVTIQAGSGFFPIRQELCALGWQDGSMLWQCSVDSVPSRAPLLCKGGTLLFESASQVAVGISALDGHELFRVPQARAIPGNSSSFHLLRDGLLEEVNPAGRTVASRRVEFTDSCLAAPTELVADSGQGRYLLGECLVGVGVEQYTLHALDSRYEYRWMASGLETFDFVGDVVVASRSSRARPDPDTLLGLRADTGAELWRVRGLSQRPLKVLGHTQNVAVVSSPTSVYGFDAQSGRRLWTIAVPEFIADARLRGQTLLVLSTPKQERTATLRCYRVP